MQNRLYTTREDALACGLGNLEILGCENCGFVWNERFDDALINYAPEYENNQLGSGVFERHAREIAQRIVTSIPAGEKLRLVEAGCGQGDFIRLLQQVAGDRLEWAIGLDPALREEIERDNLSLQRAFFNADYRARMPGAPNVVVSRHTIEHIAQPMGFLAALRDAMPDEDCRLFLETPCFSWIQKHLALEDLFYEHCSLFSPYSMELALRQSRFQPVQIEHVFGEQYLLVEAVPGQRSQSSASFTANFQAFSAAREGFVRSWRERLSEQRIGGPSRKCAVWGAGAKGVTFSQLMHSDCVPISGLIDINPNKQGRYAAVSGIQVVAPQQAAAAGITTAVVMNPNYLGEIQALCRNEGLSIDLISIDEVARGLERTV